MSTYTVNATPNDPVLDTNWVPESATSGTVVGRISVSDPDGDALSVSIVDAYGDTDLASAFELVYDPAAGNYKLVVRDAAKINYEVVGGTINLRIKVADATQAVFKDFAITVVDVNEAPTDIIIRNRTVEEHAAAGTWVTDIGGNDPDAGDVLSYSLKDAATSPFEIGRNEYGVYQLRVRDGSQIDYASDPDKKIEVTIVATDKYGLKVEKTFMLDIIDVNHAPTDVVLSQSWVMELEMNGYAVGELSTTDPDAGDSFTYTLIDDAGGRFGVNLVDGNWLLTVKDGSKLDYEQNFMHEVRARVTDSAGATFDKVLRIDVLDWLNEVTTGTDADDIFLGGFGGDRLGGGKGNDTLSGASGRDTLTGNEGQDVFIFDQVATSANRDTVVDFSVGEDKIHLKGDKFRLVAWIGGPLPEEKFFRGTEATETSHRIGYDSASGKLYYDHDGSGTTYTVVEIATFSNLPLLSVNDFLIVV